MATREAARILLAGDEMPLLCAAEKLLHEKGYICDCTADTREAAAALEMQPYDLLIADLDMPGNWELELVRASQRDGRSMPAIVMTGRPTVSTAVQSLHLGVVVDYLIKPVDAMELLLCVGPAVETGRLWRVVLRTYDGMRTRVGDIEDLERRMVAAGWKQVTAELARMLESCLKQTVEHLAQIAWSLKGTLDAVKQGCPLRTTDVCALLNCPRLAAYEESLRNTITVLKKTKNAFK